MKTHGDWKDFLNCVTEHQVKYLLVGAHAVAIHGRPRFTGDLDVIVSRKLSNAKRLVSALDAFGFPNVPAEPFTEYDRMLTLGREPIRIDIFTHIPGVVFDDAWERRIEVEFGGTVVPVLGRDDLISSKKASGRPKDLIDLELLELKPS